MFTKLAAGLVAAAFATHANAASVFASGPIYGGPSSEQAICYVVNVGVPSVNVTSLAILDMTGKVVAQTQCGQLSSRRQCQAIFGSAQPNSLYSCTAAASLSTALRGSIELRNIDGGNATVLNSQPLR